MSGQTRHPGTEALADFRAGLTGRLRGRRLAAHLAECQECASNSDRLAEVSAVLAAIPAPSLPGDVERQITAAIGAEAAARSQRVADPDTPERAGRRQQASRRVWSRRIPLYPGRTVPLTALVPALACVVLAIVGFVLSSGPGPSRPAVADGGSTASQPPRISGSTLAPGERPHSVSPAERGPVATFVVIASDTNYQQATLGAQVRQQVAARSNTGHNTIKPSGSLVGCVFQVTGNVSPSLVVHARYESKPAYVIAVSNRAWVVAPSCTAADPALITSVALSPVS